MPQQALLFIPDISGFTEFVHHTEITHSQHIISELLEILIDNNSMDLTLAEIEGDALFFYKVGDQVDQAKLDEQIKKMYLAFHAHLKRYEYQRICNCGACSSAYNLSLKFVTHFGEIEMIEVKQSKKPFGSNVIRVHRLLKNEIPLTEYVIFTEDVINLEEAPENKISAKYDFGTISYVYKPLDKLKEEVPEVKPIPEDIPRHKIYTYYVEVKAPILELYEVISNFDYRLLWVDGIDKLEYEKNKVNRAGTKHQCLINKKTVNQTTITKKAEPNQMVYGESTDEIPFTKRLNAYYVLEEIKPKFTKLKIEVYVDFKPFGIIMRPLLKKNFGKVISKNIKDLILLFDSGFKPNIEKNEDHK